MSLRLQAAARTHVGLVRRRNEDAFYAGKALFVVADGLGGHVDGDIASSTVIEILRAYDRLVEPAGLPDALGHAVFAANQALRRKTDSDPKSDGMGTTLVAMLFSGATAVLANVGDSRAYRVRDGKFTRLTEDHIYGNLVADARVVPTLPDRITRFLDGRIDGRSPDLTVKDIRPGDRFLLCSDGLTNAVPAELISDTMSQPSNPDQTAEHLVAQAVDHGGPDNITVIVVHILGDPAAA